MRYEIVVIMSLGFVLAGCSLHGPADMDHESDGGEALDIDLASALDDGTDENADETPDDGEDSDTLASGTVIVSGAIRGDTIWTNRVEDSSVPDYLVVGDIQVHALLTIDPGVTVWFDAGTALDITEEGTLVAEGSASERIRFTGEPVSGFWAGIVVRSGDVRNIIAYADIEYAGGRPLDKVQVINEYSIAMTTVETSSKLALSHVNIGQGAGGGIFLDVDVGGRVSGELTLFEAVRIFEHAGDPVVLPASQVSKLDPSSRYGEAPDAAVVIYESSLWGPEAHTWRALSDGTPYRVAGDVTLRTGLFLDPGVNLWFDPETRLVISQDEAFLSAIGTEAEPVVFTGTVVGIPSWKGILFDSRNVLNEMRFVHLSFGGSSSLENDVEMANILLNGARLDLSDAVVSDSGGYGVVLVDDCTFEERNVDYLGNRLGAIATTGDSP